MPPLETPHSQPPHECWDCGYHADSASLAGTVTPLLPEPDSLAVCLNCGALGIYNTDLTQRKLSDAEYLALDASTRQDLARIEAARRKSVGGVIGDIRSSRNPRNPIKRK